MAKIWLKKILAVILLAAMAVFLGCDTDDDSDDTEKIKNPPKTPELYFVSSTASQINLQWEIKGHKAKGFIIQRSFNPADSFSQIAEVGGKKRSYVDAGLEDNTAYFYRIKAYNNDGKSDYSDIVQATTEWQGFGLCVTRINGGYFPCFNPECGQKLDNADYISVPAADVLNCLGVEFKAPSTMTINFYFQAQADSCFLQPYFEVKVGGVSEIYSFDCNASASSSIIVTLADGQTIADISFGLFAGDWGSTVNIYDIVFFP